MNNLESTSVAQAPPKKKMNGCLIAALVLIGLGVLGVGGCFLVTGAVFSNAAKEEKEKIEALKSATPSDLSPNGELADIFNFNSKNTDLQRDNKEKEIIGKIVQWNLKVYEVNSSGKSFRVQTHAGVNFMGQSPVGVFVDITPMAEGDAEYLTALKTDDVIPFIGYIDGTSMRHLEISPAIIYHGSGSKKFRASPQPSDQPRPAVTAAPPLSPAKVEKTNNPNFETESIEPATPTAESHPQVQPQAVPQGTELSLEKARFEQEKAQLATDRARWELEKERAQLELEKTQLEAQRESEAAKQAAVEPVETNKNPTVVAPASGTGSPTVPAMAGERYPETRLHLLGPVDLMDLNLNDLRYAINEMYARRGVVFRQTEIAKSFTSKEWYKPRPGVSFEDIEKEFSTIETDNLRLLGKERDRKTASADYYELIDSESNLREGPGTNYPIVRKSQKGEVGEALSNKNGWMKLQFSGGSIAWAHEQNLKTVK